MSHYDILTDGKKKAQRGTITPDVTLERENTKNIIRALKTVYYIHVLHMSLNRFLLETLLIF